MIFNPIIHFILAVIAGMLGFLALNDMNSWLCMIPCVFFTMIFFASLFFPEMIVSVARYRAGYKGRIKAEASIRQGRVPVETAGNRSSSPFGHFGKLNSSSLRSHSRSPHGLNEFEKTGSAGAQTEIGAAADSCATLTK